MDLVWLHCEGGKLTTPRLPTTDLSKTTSRLRSCHRLLLFSGTILDNRWIATTLLWALIVINLSYYNPVIASTSPKQIMDI